MSDLESLKTLFDEKKVAPELYEAAKALVEEEKNRGIKEASKANKEAQSFRKHKIALEELAKANGLEKIDDPEAFVGGILDKMKGAGDKESAVTRELAEIKKTLKAKELKEAELEEKAKRVTIKSKAFAEFEKSLIGAKLHLEDVIRTGRLTLAEDGETVVWKKDDDEIPFEEGLRAYVAENKDSAKNTQKPGAKSKPGSSAKPNGNQKTVSELETMSAREKALFFKNGGEQIAG
jgi:hypothetical protein